MFFAHFIPLFLVHSEATFFHPLSSSLSAVLPETLKIRVEPKALTAGTEASLFCDSSSSNPPVRLSWYKDGIPLMSEGGVSNQPGLWGGKISSTQVKLNITQDMNGVKIACQVVFALLLIFFVLNYLYRYTGHQRSTPEEY